jgi:hypothetical protein
MRADPTGYELTRLYVQSKSCARTTHLPFAACSSFLYNLLTTIARDPDNFKSLPTHMPAAMASDASTSEGDSSKESEVEQPQPMNKKDKQKMKMKQLLQALSSDDESEEDVIALQQKKQPKVKVEPVDPLLILFNLPVAVARTSTS